MRVSLCLEMIFRNLPFLERIEQARSIGYDIVEFWGWEDKPLHEIADQVGAGHVSIGAFSANRRHGLFDPCDRECLLAEVRASLETAKVLGCGNLMLLACPLRPDGSAEFSARPSMAIDLDREALESLRALSALAADYAVVLNIEPLNTLVDHPGYPLESSGRAFGWVAAVGSPWIRVLYDVYHMYLMGEDVLHSVVENLPSIGYLHVADAPGRHEPGSGGIAYPELCSRLRVHGYHGIVGLEFSPSGDDHAAARAALRCFDR